jgi:dolichol kinase
MGPMICAAMYYSALRLAAAPTPMPLLPPTWRIEAPLLQPDALVPLNALQAVVRARRMLVDLGTLCPIIMLIHVYASWWTEHLYRKVKTVPEGERGSVPRKESKRLWRYAIFTVAVSLALASLRVAMPFTGCGIWQSTPIFTSLYTT